MSAAQAIINTFIKGLRQQWRQDIVPILDDVAYQSGIPVTVVHAAAMQMQHWPRLPEKQRLMISYAVDLLNKDGHLYHKNESVPPHAHRAVAEALSAWAKDAPRQALRTYLQALKMHSRGLPMSEGKKQALLSLSVAVRHEVQRRPHDFDGGHIADGILNHVTV